MRTWTPFLVFSGLLLACDNGNAGADGSTGIDAATTGRGTSSSGGTTTNPETGSFSTSSGVTTEPGSEDNGEDPPEPPITFDIGATPDFGEFVDGCNAVDFLFVIDNSGSMNDAQANLVSNFPAFIDGIQSTLTEVESYHVGVITTDDHNSFFDPSNPPECRQLGALVTSTAGIDSSNTACGPYTEGFNFITEEDDLAASFACAARVGTAGAGAELTMNALEAAIGEDLNAPGACNESFVRDEALLVVVVITDEADGPGDGDGPPPASSTGTPASWYQSVLDAKDGVPENAAGLVLTNYAGGPCLPTSATDDGVNLVEFAGLFNENGFVAGICEPDYGPSFAQATAVIEQACENFIPPG